LLQLQLTPALSKPWQVSIQWTCTWCWSCSFTEQNNNTKWVGEET
jgi:hypothetical protein